MYARYRFVQYAAVCHYRPLVCASGVSDWAKPCQVYNERTSTDLNLVTAYSTVHEPPEDGLKN
jgi:hypothetical protein